MSRKQYRKTSNIAITFWRINILDWAKKLKYNYRRIKVSITSFITHNFKNKYLIRLVSLVWLIPYFLKHYLLHGHHGVHMTDPLKLSFVHSQGQEQFFCHLLFFLVRQKIKLLRNVFFWFRSRLSTSWFILISSPARSLKTIRHLLLFGLLFGKSCCCCCCRCSGFIVSPFTGKIFFCLSLFSFVFSLFPSQFLPFSS